MLLKTPRAAYVTTANTRRERADTPDLN